MRNGLAIILISVVGYGPALAQPGDTPPPAPAPQPAPPAPQPAVDSAEVTELYDRAIEAFGRSDFAAAAPLFEEVARRSVEVGRRAAAAELAAQSRSRIAAQPPTAAELDAPSDKENGRAAFLGSTVVLGLNYGWMVPAALSVSDDKAFVGLYLLTAGAAFTVPYVLTRDDHITRSMSTLGGIGGFLGIAHGALLYGTIAGDDGFDGDDNGRALIATMLAGSIAEGTVGYLWARNSQMSPGNAVAISSGSLWGLGFAAGANVLAADEDTNTRLILGSMLLGSAAGGFAGKIYGDNRRLTEADASLVSYTGILGTYAALTTLVAADVDSGRAYAGTMMAGAAVGLVVGDRLIQDRDYTRGEAAVLSLGSLAGALLGAGGGFLLSPDENNTEKWILPASAAGALGGFALMYSIVEPSAEPGKDNGPTVQLAPMAGPNGETMLGAAGTF